MLMTGLSPQRSRCCVTPQAISFFNYRVSVPCSVLGLAAGCAINCEAFRSMPSFIYLTYDSFMAHWSTSVLWFSTSFRGTRLVLPGATTNTAVMPSYSGQHVRPAQAARGHCRRYEFLIGGSLQLLLMAKMLNNDILALCIVLTPLPLSIRAALQFAQLFTPSVLD